MSVRIRCRACGRYSTIPDHYEAVKNYCATGGMIQTLVQRIVAQPIHYHYHTPAPLWRATAFALLPAFFAPAATLYWHIDPMWSGGLSVFCLAAGLVIGSTQVEQTEITDEPPADDEPEDEKDEPGPVPPVEVSTPYKNSMSIRMAHQPPRDPNPHRQIKLGRADLALAKLVTGEAAISPVSFANAKRVGYKHGEPTFYIIQHHWIEERLAFSTTTGSVYLKPSGQRTLTQYASQ